MGLQQNDDDRKRMKRCVKDCECVLTGVEATDNESVHLGEVSLVSLPACIAIATAKTKRQLHLIPVLAG